MIKICSCAKANKMADTCANKLRHEFCSFAKMLFYAKPPHFNSIFCSTEPIQRSSGRFVTVCQNRTGHTLTQLASYCGACVPRINYDPVRLHFVYVARAKDILSLNDSDDIHMYTFQFHSELTTVV